MNVNPVKISAAMHITREQMGWFSGPAEEAKVEQWRKKAAEQRARIDKALAAAPAELQPIIELHSPTSGDECRGCDAGTYAESGADWPCSTTALIIGEDACA